MKGQVSHELEVNVPAGQAWELYGTIKLVKLVEKEYDTVEEIEVVEGDGGVGTILHIKFTPGTPGFAGYKEKFIEIDNEKRVRVTDVVEGGYLDVGFTLFRVIFEIIEKGSDSCIIKSTIEYELKEEAAANASFVSTDAVAKIAEICNNYLLNNKA